MIFQQFFFKTGINFFIFTGLPPPPGMRPPFMSPGHVLFSSRAQNPGPQNVIEKGPEIKKVAGKEGKYLCKLCFYSFLFYL